MNQIEKKGMLKNIKDELRAKKLALLKERVELLPLNNLIS